MSNVKSYADTVTDKSNAYKDMEDIFSDENLEGIIYYLLIEFAFRTIR